MSAMGQNPYYAAPPEPSLERHPSGGIFASETFRGHAHSGVGAVQEPKWLPWVLIGGSIVVAGGIIWTAYQSRR